MEDNIEENEERREDKDIIKIGIQEDSRYALKKARIELLEN